MYYTFLNLVGRLELRRFKYGPFTLAPPPPFGQNTMTHQPHTRRHSVRRIILRPRQNCSDRLGEHPPSKMEVGGRGLLRGCPTRKEQVQQSIQPNLMAKDLTIITVRLEPQKTHTKYEFLEKRKDYDKSETTYGKLSTRRIQICFVYFWVVHFRPLPPFSK